LGLDLSLNSSGVAYVKEGKAIIYKSCSSIKTIKERIHFFFELLPEIDRETTVFIENYAYGAKGRGTFDIPEFSGIVKYILRQHVSNIYTIPPTCIKKYVTGKGNAKKIEVMEHLNSQYSTNFNTDMAEAFACALMGNEFLKNNNNFEVIRSWM
jgi:Holliday junction resolvasome RuvABC endonuclease subunit